MVPEWGFVHMLHLAMSFIICPQTHQTKNNKKRNIDFYSPCTLSMASMYLYHHKVAVMVKVDTKRIPIKYHIPFILCASWEFQCNCGVLKHMYTGTCRMALNAYTHTREIGIYMK